MTKLEFNCTHELWEACFKIHVARVAGRRTSKHVLSAETIDALPPESVRADPINAVLIMFCFPIQIKIGANFFSFSTLR